MVIYLVGKGFAFSPETSTTGREQKQGCLEKKKKEEDEKGRRSGIRERKIYH